jgi:hypothetical protein
MIMLHFQRKNKDKERNELMTTEAEVKLRTDPNNFQPGGYYLLLKKERNRPVVLLIILKLDSNFLHWGDITVRKEKLPKKMTVSGLEKNGWKHLSRETASADEEYVRRAFYHDRISFHHATLSETCYFKSREDFFRSMAECLKIGLKPSKGIPVNLEELFKPRH